MMNLYDLLKQKSYSDLTETEQVFVLKTMTAEDYKAEHKIVVLSEKLKLNQAYLVPKNAIKAQLLAKIPVFAKPILSWQTVFRVAASLIFCIGLFFFLQKNKPENTTIATVTELKTAPSVIAQLPTPTIESQPIKNIKNKNKKRIVKQIAVTPKEEDEDALAQSFNRKNPNLAWQTEDDEVVSEKPTLQCAPN